MRGLYAIVDVESLERRGLDPVTFAEHVLAASPAAMQLRDKNGGARRTLDLLRAIAPMAKERGVPMYANDRADLALLAGCDGVHVGQEDLPIALVRALVTGRGRALRVGLSTHDEAQVDAAIFEAPDYIAIGPIFPTKSKDKPSPVVGLDRLAGFASRVREKRPDLPIVAIGGITIDNAAEVGAIVDAAAVIQALLPDADGPSKWGEVRARAEAIGAAIRGEERAS